MVFQGYLTAPKIFVGAVIHTAIVAVIPLEVLPAHTHAQAQRVGEIGIRLGIKSDTIDVPIGDEERIVGVVSLHRFVFTINVHPGQPVGGVKQPTAFVGQHTQIKTIGVTIAVIVIDTFIGI